MATHNDPARAAVTPSMARGIRVTPRLPEFVFDDTNLPEQWFADDVGITAAWNGLGVFANVAETLFVAAGRKLLARIDDPAVADETARFMQQEAIHSAMHARMNRCLAARGLPVEAARGFMQSLVDEAERRGGSAVFMALGLAGEQAIGELAHAVLSEDAPMADAAEAPRALFLWHFYEEVEHQAALHDGWEHVYGRGPDARAMRVLGAAYAVTAIAVSMPALAWAMVPASRRGERWRGATWGPALRQLLGDRGLLRGAARNLRALPRLGFHPFDMHDPVSMLQRAKGFVQGIPEAPTKAPRAGNAPTGEAPAVGPRDVARCVGFVGWSVVRAARFMAAH